MALPAIGPEVRRLRLSQVEWGSKMGGRGRGPNDGCKRCETLTQLFRPQFCPSSLNQKCPLLFSSFSFYPNSLILRTISKVYAAKSRAKREAILRTPTSTPTGWTAIANGPTTGASSPNS